MCLKLSQGWQPALQPKGLAVNFAPNFFFPFLRKKLKTFKALFSGDFLKCVSFLIHCGLRRRKKLILHLPFASKEDHKLAERNSRRAAWTRFDIDSFKHWLRQTKTTGNQLMEWMKVTFRHQHFDSGEYEHTLEYKDCMPSGFVPLCFIGSPNISYWYFISIFHILLVFFFFFKLCKVWSLCIWMLSLCFFFVKYFSSKPT